MATPDLTHNETRCRPNCQVNTRSEHYACSHAATKGRKACPGRSIRMEHLDEIVLDAIETRLLVPDRLKELLSGLASRILEKRSAWREREKDLNRELRHVEQSIERLYEAIENGLVQDEDTFRRRLSKHTQRRDELIHLRAVNRQRHDVPPKLLSNRNLDAFGRALKAKLREPGSVMARNYVRFLVDQVVVGEQRIGIKGQKSGLLEAASDPETFFRTGVSSFVREWRSGRDSNPRYPFKEYGGLANRWFQPLTHRS